MFMWMRARALVCMTICVCVSVWVWCPTKGCATRKSYTTNMIIGSNHWLHTIFHKPLFPYIRILSGSSSTNQQRDSFPFFLFCHPKLWRSCRFDSRRTKLNCFEFFCWFYVFCTLPVHGITQTDTFYSQFDCLILTRAPTTSHTPHSLVGFMLEMVFVPFGFNRCVRCPRYVRSMPRVNESIYVCTVCVIVIVAVCCVALLFVTFHFDKSTMRSHS